jgi:hypothetical protein
VLRNALSNLQMAYVEVAQKTPGAGAPGLVAVPEDQRVSPQTVADEPSKTSEPISTPSSGEPESKKKFTKSYGS